VGLATSLRRAARATILVAAAGLLAHGAAAAQEDSDQIQLLAYFPFDGASVEEAAGDSREHPASGEQTSLQATAVVAVETVPAGVDGPFEVTGVPQGPVSPGEPLTVPGLDPGTYVTTMIDPAPGFDITGARCDDGESPMESSGDATTRSMVFNLDPGERVTCTYTVTQRGTVAVAVETVPADLDASVAVTGVPQGRFRPGQPLAAPELKPGTYTATMIDPAPELEITGARCDDGESPMESMGDATTRSMVFNLDPGERVTCTYTVERARDADKGNVALLAYFPFDGASVEEAARGIESAVVVAGEEEFDGFGVVSDDGDTPRGSTTGAVDPDGRYGDALAFTEESGRVLAPLDLDFGTHPRITVSMWVKVESAEAAERGFLLSTGHGSDRTPGLRLVNGHVVASAGGGQLHNYAGDLRVGEWNHVAAIWDAEARTVRVYTNGRGDERTDIEHLDPDVIAEDRRSQSELENPLHPEWLPTRHLVLGAQGIGGSRELRGVSMDEVRIWSGTLTNDEFEEIMNAESPPPLGPVAPPPPPPEERETVAAADEDDRFDPPAEEEVEDRGDLSGWELRDDYELSVVSGSTGEETTRAEFSGSAAENAYVRGIEIWERANRPCMLVLDAQVSGERAPTVHGLSSCDATDASKQLEVSPGNSSRDVVTELQVCQRRTNDRVKGVRLRTKRWEIGDDRIVFREESEDEDEAPNCNGNWQQTVSCPSGSVAAGAIAHWRVVARGTIPNPKASLVGVQLMCRAMVSVYR
jgi:hypothetical protein